MPNYFYPRPPRGGRRFSLSSKGTVNLFLSTPSARRATQNFRRVMQDILISIHALREEGDNSRKFVFHGFNVFLSTPSARRATKLDRLKDNLDKISIHALREEGDMPA